MILFTNKAWLVLKIQRQGYDRSYRIVAICNKPILAQIKLQQCPKDKNCDYSIKEVRLDQESELFRFEY